jgi:GntR family transcriptional regulator
MPLRSGVPRYRLIEAILRDQIFSGELHEGDRVPTEEQLTRTYRVSRPTVRRALGVLQRERLILRTARRGTFVNRIATELPQPKTRLTLDALGAPQRWKIMLHRHGKAAARGEAQAALGVAHGEEIFYFIRSYHQGGRPVCAAKIYLRSNAGALLTKRDLVSPKYAEILSRKLGVRLASTHGHLEALLADSRTGAILGARPGSALLSLRRNAYTASGEPVEHVHMLFRSDLCQIDFSQPWT